MGQLLGGGPEEIYGVSVGGKALREKLLADKREARQGFRAEPMGKTYYDGLRETYSSSESPAKALFCGGDASTVKTEKCSWPCWQ